MRNSTIVLISMSALFSLTSIWAGCEKSTVNEHLLSLKIDSLKKQVSGAYIPGTGEIMNGIIQPHHYKLWLAGQTKNWKLAAYESDLLAGGFKRIEKYHQGSKTAEAIPMINPELTAINKAIRNKDKIEFKNGFVLLTNACNTCHSAMGYDFNIIKVPSKPAFENQQF